MKLIEQNFDITLQAKKLTGVASIADRKNYNGRIYPIAELSREARKLQAKIISGDSVLLSLDHPDTTIQMLSSAAAKLSECKMQRDAMVIEAEVLNTTAGNDLLEIIRSGIQVGFSTRGTGSIDAAGNVRDYNLVTIDLVSDPSCKEAIAQLMESRSKGVSKPSGDRMIPKDVYMERLNEMLSPESFDRRIQEAEDNLMKQLFGINNMDNDLPAIVDAIETKTKDIYKDYQKAKFVNEVCNYALKHRRPGFLKNGKIDIREVFNQMEIDSLAEKDTQLRILLKKLNIAMRSGDVFQITTAQTAVNMRVDELKKEGK